MAGPEPEGVSSGSFSGLPAEEPYPGLRRRHFNTERATVNSYEFDAGAEFPLHKHPQEQLTLVTRGEVRMSLGGATTSLSSGDWSVVPGGIEHGITAGPEGATIVAVIMPRRDSVDDYELAQES